MISYAYYWTTWKCLEQEKLQSSLTSSQVKIWKSTIDISDSTLIFPALNETLVTKYNYLWLFSFLSLRQRWNLTRGGWHHLKFKYDAILSLKTIVMHTILIYQKVNLLLCPPSWFLKLSLPFSINFFENMSPIRQRANIKL